MVAILFFLPSMAAAQYESVVSVHPATEGSCIAVEIPTAAALGGLRWFHNDGTQVFPRVVIIEGEAGAAPDLTNPGLILDQVAGVSAGWGELTLSSPVTSSTGIAYAVFFFPVGESTSGLGEGGGPGIGFREKSVDNPAFYITADAVNWARFAPSYALGVEPVYVALRGVTPRTIAEVGMQVPLPELALFEESEETTMASGALTASPNPFNPRVELSFSLRIPSEVQLRVYDLRGRLVKTVVSGTRAAGVHSVIWNGTDDQGRRVASGVYFARFEGGEVVQTQRLVMLK
jgi:hypothetical protein